MRGQIGVVAERRGDLEKFVRAERRPRPDRRVTNSIDGPQTKIDGVSLPTSYGVYARIGGKLAALKPLPIKVPDPRIAISAVISTPSPTTLPDGHVSFIVFRRDLLNNAPDHASVRVVAHYARSHVQGWGAGKDNWTWMENGAVRGKSYGMSVSPVHGNPRWLPFAPTSRNFSLPAGRYALVLNRDGYDFAVAGPIAVLAQCLEQTQAVDPIGLFRVPEALTGHFASVRPSCIGCSGQSLCSSRRLFGVNFALSFAVFLKLRAQGVAPVGQRGLGLYQKGILRSCVRDRLNAVQGCQPRASQSATTVVRFGRDLSGCEGRTL